MRNIVMLIFALVVGSLSLLGQQIEFDRTKHDFGTIAEEAGVVTTVFTIKNVSNRPFIITSVVSSCGCTTPKYQKAPLMPGKSTTMEVVFDPAGRPGYFSKDISIYSDNRKREDKLIISGVVSPRPRTKAEEFPFTLSGELMSTTNLISFPALDRGAPYTQIIELYNPSSSPVSLSAAASKPSSKVKLLAQTIAPKGTTKLEYTLNLTNESELGEFNDVIEIKANGVMLDKKIVVEAIVVPNFSLLTNSQMSSSPQIFLSSQFYHFSVVKSGETLNRTFTISNRGKRDLVLEKIFSSSSKLAYKISKTVIPAGESQDITLTLSTKGDSGRVSEKITIVCNDPAMPVKDIRLAASLSSQ